MEPQKQPYLSFEAIYLFDRRQYVVFDKDKSDSAIIETVLYKTYRIYYCYKMLFMTYYVLLYCVYLFYLYLKLTLFQYEICLYL